MITLLQLSHFPPFTPLHPVHPIPPTFPPYSSCPWVIHISSLASTFRILFLTSTCPFLPTIYASYSLYLFHHSYPLPTGNPPCDCHFCDAVPVLVVCLFVFVFTFVLGSVVNNCELSFYCSYF